MTFPTLGILDNFNRANEGPPPGANWVNGYFTNKYGADPNYTLKVDTNKAVVNETAGGGSVYNTIFNEPVEFYFTVAAVQAIGNSYFLNWAVQSRDVYTTEDYYLGVVGINGFPTVNLFVERDYLDHTVELYNQFVNLGGFDVGDKYGIRQTGASIEIWTNIAGGGWTLLATVTDPDTPMSSGYASLETYTAIPSLDSAFDDFGGGEFTVPVAPVADFSGTPTSGDRTLAVTFTDASTNTPTSWAWTFGDGGTSTAQNPSHNYTVAGTYTVALTATNAAGSDTKTRTNYITVNATPPVADFTGTPTSGEQTLAVTFTDATTNSPTSWAWSFGDGGTSTAQNPSHNYTLQGVYTVVLTATNIDGSDTKTRTNYITVNLAAPSGLTATTQSPSKIHLTWTDNSTGEVGFKIERKDSGAYAQIDTVGAEVTEYMDSGLTPSTTYTYRVRAYN